MKTSLELEEDALEAAEYQANISEQDMIDGYSKPSSRDMKIHNPLADVNEYE
jgi:hypothetical protein